MGRWIVLLRGINVGGHNKLPMADLRVALGDAGYADVTTYIQSGNIALTAPTCTPDAISAVIADRFGLDVPAVVITPERLREVVTANPFPEMEDEPKFLHLFVCNDPIPLGADEAIDPADHAPDRFAFGRSEIYVAYPQGQARSKLTNAVFDRVTGQVTTGRNWNTVRKLLDLAG